MPKAHNVKLLVPCDVDLNDRSLEALTASVGSPAQVLARSKFGAGAVDFYNGYLEYDITIGTKDFTVEYWFILDALGANRHMFGAGPTRTTITNSAGIFVYWNTGNVMKLYSGSELASFDFTPNIGQWYHFAVSRKAGVLRMFIDGNQIGEHAFTNDIGQYIRFAGDNHSGIDGVDGAFDDIRVTAGEAVYFDAAFDVPTEAYTAPDVQDPGEYDWNLTSHVKDGFQLYRATDTSSSAMASNAGMTGKVYFEIMCKTSPGFGENLLMVGTAKEATDHWVAGTCASIYCRSGSTLGLAGGTACSGLDNALRKIIRVAYDFDDQIFWVGDESGWKNGDPENGTAGTTFPADHNRIHIGNGGDAITFHVNAGETAFAFPMPSGWTTPIFDSGLANWHTYKDELDDLSAEFFWRLHTNGDPSSNEMSGGNLPVHQIREELTNIVETTGPGYWNGLGEALELSTTSGKLIFINSATAPDNLKDIGAAGSAFTVGGWVRTTSSEGTGLYWYSTVTFFEIRNEGGLGNHVLISLGLMSGGQVQFGHADNYTASNERKLAAGLPEINDGNWHFVVVVRNGPSLTIYVDGSANVHSTTVNDWNTNVGNTVIANGTIGCRNSDGGDQLAVCVGAYAGWFVAPSALTAANVDTLMDLGQSAVESVVAPEGKTIRIQGTVFLDDAPVEATLRLYEAITGAFRQEVMSDASTGFYKFEYVTEGEEPAAQEVTLQSGDELWGNVKALLSFDGTPGATDYTDSSDNASAITQVGTALSDAQKKFGDTSIAMTGGATEEVKVATGDIGSAGWTIEGWFYIADTAHRIAFIIPAGSLWLLYFRNDGTMRLYNGSNYISTASVWNTATWYHIALTCSDADAVELFFNGVRVGTTSLGAQAWGDHFFIGGPVNSGINPLNGYADEIRFTTGVRYTETFTPPDAAFPTSSSPEEGGGTEPAWMEEDETYFVKCIYGENIRPLVHGPIAPQVITPGPEVPTSIWEHKWEFWNANTGTGVIPDTGSIGGVDATYEGTINSVDADGIDTDHAAADFIVNLPLFGSVDLPIYDNSVRDKHTIAMRYTLSNANTPRIILFDPADVTGMGLIMNSTGGTSWRAYYSHGTGSYQNFNPGNILDAPLDVFITYDESAASGQTVKIHVYQSGAKGHTEDFIAERNQMGYIASTCTTGYLFNRGSKDKAMRGKASWFGIKTGVLTDEEMLAIHVRGTPDSPTSDPTMRFDGTDIDLDTWVLWDMGDGGHINVQNDRAIMRGVTGAEHSGGGWYLKNALTGPPTRKTRVKFTFNMSAPFGTPVNPPLFGFCKHPVTYEGTYYAVPAEGVWLYLGSAGTTTPNGMYIAYTSQGTLNPTIGTGAAWEDFEFGVDYEIELFFDWNAQTLTILRDTVQIVGEAPFPVAEIMDTYLNGPYTFAMHTSRYNDDADVTVDNLLITEEL